MTAEADLAARVDDAVGTAPRELVELEGGLVGTVRRARFADRPDLAVKTSETPLAVEAFMLDYLAERSTLPVPEVVAASDDLLLTEYVPGATTRDPSPAVQRDAADRLASLHGVTAAAFGFPRDTLNGPLVQPNPWTDSWPSFFGERRLRPAAAAAREAGAVDAALVERVDALRADLDAVLREPTPSLVHGDAWTGNVLVRDGAVAAFVDPATYYADPEVELAYVRWTETFGDPFFERYRERRGLDSGFEERYPAYVLYPALVHAYCVDGDRYPDVAREMLDRLGY